MNKYFHYFHPSCSEETLSYSVYDADIIALKEILMFELQQIAYYIKKLGELGVDVCSKRDKVVDFIVLVITNLHVKRENFEFIISDLEENNEKLQAHYTSLCAEKGVIPELLDDISNLRLKKLSEINVDERQNILKKKVFDSDKYIFYEIIVKLVQKSSVLISELKEYGVINNSANEAVVEILSKCNFINENNDVWIKYIDDFSKINFKLNLSLCKVLNKIYGFPQLRRISVNPLKGKAILVSGHFYRDLEKILEATKELDINIYTHSDLLMAHAYDKFSHYPNLKGHYQKAYNNIQLDFASFPGPILVTSHSIPNAGIIRGQIYTLDNFPVFGFTKIENDDFTPIINYARKSAGFKNDSEELKISVGYDTEKLFEQFKELALRVNNGEIKHIFVLGGLDRFQPHDKYFETFMEICPKDCFIVSFSYDLKKENLLHINSNYDFHLLWEMLDRLNEDYGFQNYPVSVFITSCNSNTFSNILNLRALGIKDIFISAVYSNYVNPNIVSGLVNYFGVKIISESPEKDIEKIIGN